MKMELKKIVKYAFSFLNPNGARKSHGSLRQSLNQELPLQGRNTISVGGQDLTHDNSVFAWALDFHINNTTSFSFQPRTGSATLDETLKAVYRKFNRTLDATGRMTFEDMRRMWEKRRMLDGDVLIYRILLPDGTPAVQTFQSDWIKSDDGGGWVQGVHLDEFGRAVEFQLDYNDTEGNNIKRTLDARHCKLMAYYDGQADSFRGLAPVTPALALFQDLTEIEIFTMGKIKTESVLGLAFVSAENKNRWGFTPRPFQDPGTGGTGTNGGTLATVNANGEYIPRDAPPVRRRLDFSGGGIKAFDLDPGEDIKTFSNASPSSTYKDWVLNTIQQGLKVFKIPMVIFQESLTNYYSSKAAYGIYIHETAPVARQNCDLYTDLFRWFLKVEYDNGKINLEGEFPETVKFDFIRENHSVMDMDKEFGGLAIGIEKGLISPQEACAQGGRDYYKIIDETATACRYAQERGVLLPIMAELAKGGTEDGTSQDTEVSATV